MVELFSRIQLFSKGERYIFPKMYICLGLKYIYDRVDFGSSLLLLSPPSKFVSISLRLIHPYI